jgi:hypothetical protein
MSNYLEDIQYIHHEIPETRLSPAIRRESNITQKSHHARAPSPAIILYITNDRGFVL